MFLNDSDDASLYQRIALEIRTKIINGVYRPGDRLPAIRALADQWNCTPATIQHAYKELAQQGLVLSRPGRGSYVANREAYEKLKVSPPLRMAKLIHLSESFLLESLIAGYSYEEIMEAIDLARRYIQIDK